MFGEILESARIPAHSGSLQNITTNESWILQVMETFYFNQA